MTVWDKGEYKVKYLPGIFNWIHNVTKEVLCWFFYLYINRPTTDKH